MESPSKTAHILAPSELCLLEVPWRCCRCHCNHDSCCWNPLMPVNSAQNPLCTKPFHLSLEHVIAWYALSFLGGVKLKEISLQKWSAWSQSSRVGWYCTFNQALWETPASCRFQIWSGSNESHLRALFKRMDQSQGCSSKTHKQTVPNILRFFLFVSLHLFSRGNSQMESGPGDNVPWRDSLWRHRNLVKILWFPQMRSCQI